MQTFNPHGDSSPSPVDIEILKSSRIAPLLAKLDETFALRHCRPSTCKSYKGYVIRFILFKHHRHSMQLGAAAIQEFLTYMAVEGHVSASSQNVAFNALLFFYKHVLGIEVGKVDALRAKRTKHLPTVLTRDEVAALLANCTGDYWLANAIMYGCGLRVEVDCLELRVKDIDFGSRQVVLHDSKHGNSRSIPLPQALVEPLKGKIAEVARIHQTDLAEGFGAVDLPDALARKYPKFTTDIGWQWLFPAPARYITEDGRERRHHLHVSAVQEAFNVSRGSAGIHKPAHPHTLRHSYATHLLEDGEDIRKVQELMGHKDVKTTMVYLHVMTKRLDTKSPLDRLVCADAETITVRITDEVRRWLVAAGSRLSLTPAETAARILNTAAQGGAL